MRHDVGLALAQAVLDDLAGLWWDSVGEEHLELHHQVASLRWALRQRQALAPQPPDGAGLDDIAAWQGHHPVVECRDIDCAAAECLETKGGKTRLVLQRPVIYVLI